MNIDLFSSLGLTLSKNKKLLFEKYVKLFKEYNSHTNLISRNDEEFLFEKHIFDSLAFNLFINKYGMPQKVMDIGTGGGFPGLPLALTYDDMKIFAVDSTSKKINFINEVKNALNLHNIEPVASRIEELPLTLKSGFDVVTSRALGALPLLLEYAIPYLKTGGYLVAYKSVDSKNELLNAKNALKIMKAENVDTIEYNLPLEQNFNRKLLVFKKMGEVSPIYPRKYSVIKNNPL